MLWTAFILGLAGSLHCAGMCGPLVLAMTSGSRGGTAGLPGMIAYHAGRVGTYAVLGVVFGMLGRSLALAGLQRWVSIGSGILLLVGLGSLLPAWGSTWAVAVVGALRRTAAPWMRDPTPTARMVLGSINGLLPCGLVYAAGVGSAAAGSLLESVAYMTVFGLGTLPMMLGLSISGRALPSRWRHGIQGLVPWTLGVVGVLLIVRGLGLGIPYLSPAMGAGSCCHG